ncbi:type II secretion system protein GspH [Limnobaculum zhutongyuii]|uniref:Type II secretion system protein H n=1 Tax=Limnobaculum zhutongyuii TaxID=2498113 RepID=A0A411WNL8_9GAMM|nr:type II secretion system minor pseudopilin GspH [Limnobaculum zhutongyuii]QBH97768.1 type II secretion system protein GspH [Limnobaculum zhutongyuii]TQS87941.1 type II secretion system protein GspH [Limnobaculum zhutongyuii]
MSSHRSRGFTLLEVMLTLVIFAISATIVVMTLPSKSGPGVFGEQFKTLVDYGSSKAVMEGSIVGLTLTYQGYQLMILKGNGEGAQDSLQWQPLVAGRITTQGEFPEDLRVTIEPQKMALSLNDAPQIIFLPDGEVSLFRLTFEGEDRKDVYSVVSQGASPVEVVNGYGNEAKEAKDEKDAQ